jgi:hypothetical protein
VHALASGLDRLGLAFSSGKRLLIVRCRPAVA